MFECMFSFVSHSLLPIMYVFTHVICVYVCMLRVTFFSVTAFILLHCFINVCICLCVCVCPDEKLSGYSSLRRCPYGGIVDYRSGFQLAAERLKKKRVIF